MVAVILVQILQLAGRVITLLVIVHVVLSFFMSPFHPIRQTIDRLIDPLLAPIRRVVPPVGMIDFSPLVLLILVQVVISVVVSILISL